MMKAIITFFMGRFLHHSVNGKPFTIGAITYEIVNSDNFQVKVKEVDINISGKLIIPSEVLYKNRCYSVTIIGSWAFSRCKNLSTVIIPESVSVIQEYAFNGCTSLSSLILPLSITNIENNAFSHCTCLKKIIIPKSVIKIGDNVFSFCQELNEIKVDANNPNYCSIDCVLYNKSATRLISFPAGRKGEYELPLSATTIGNSAFLSCINLTSITIPQSVTHIDDWAFCSCFGLTKIIILSQKPPLVGIDAFYGVPEYAEIYVPKGYKERYATADKWCKFSTFHELRD